MAQRMWSWQASDGGMQQGYSSVLVRYPEPRIRLPDCIGCLKNFVQSNRHHRIKNSGSLNIQSYSKVPKKKSFNLTVPGLFLTVCCLAWISNFKRNARTFSIWWNRRHLLTERPDSWTMFTGVQSLEFSDWTPRKTCRRKTWLQGEISWFKF